MHTSWVLNTASSTYAVSLALDETALVLDYFGPRADPVPRWELPTSLPVMSTVADYAPVEYAALGTRNVHGSELILEFDDGARGGRFRYADHRFEELPEQSHLTVRFVEPRGVEIEQHTLTRADSDVVERWVVLRDTRKAGAPIRAARAFSGAVCLNAPDGLRVDYLAGSWVGETRPHSVDLRLGTFRMGSRQGLTGHLFAPTIAVTPLGGDGEPLAEAGTIGVALAWSGSWAMAVEGHPTGLFRMSAGLDDEGTALLLTPGREVETPHMLLVHETGGPQAVSRTWHRHQREIISRSISPRNQPVIYNSWEATEFDVRESHQLELAKIAADVGAEVFVVDDGWFVGRVDGDAALGDWTPDPLAFPDGLRAFAEKIVGLGMRFGLWIELEAMSPKSELFRQHPDWAYSNEGVPQTYIRDQLVLDLGRPEVFEWMEQTLRRLLTEQPITYLKWDMNRPITSPGRPDDPSAIEWSLTHTRAYYKLLEMIRREFPQVTVEVCSGGGGRVDNAVLSLADVVWASDATGPRDRLLIQDGFLRAYAPHVMSSWVTGAPGALDRAAASLEFRFVVAMAGVLGIGVDLTTWTAEERAAARSLIDLYRELRPLLHSGEVYRHGAPNQRGYALEYAGGDAHGGRIVVLAYDSARERTGPEEVSELAISRPVRVHLTSPDPTKVYRLRSDGSLHHGAVLRATGLAVPWDLACDADVLVLDPA